MTFAPVSDRTCSSKRECEPYLCTILHKCRAIDDVEIFITNSLTHLLKPKLNLSPTVKKVRLPLRHAQSESALKVPEAELNRIQAKAEVTNLISKLVESNLDEKSQSKTKIETIAANQSNEKPADWTDSIFTFRSILNGDLLQNGGEIIQWD